MLEVELAGARQHEHVFITFLSISERPAAIYFGVPH